MNFLPQSKFLIVTLSLSLLAAGCAHEKYQAKSLNPTQTSAKLLSKNITSTDFKAYLIKQGHAESQLPFATWGLDELTWCALYHHTKLDVAKAQLALANASLNVAGQRQNPTLGGSFARSNQANNDIRPWAYGLNVEIPIETVNKRQIRVEEAQHLAEAARMDVANVAWQLRSQIAKDLLRYHQNIATADVLKNELAIQTRLVDLLNKRLSLGAISSAELSAAKLRQQKAQFNLANEQTKLAEIRSNLATDVGLPVDNFNGITLKPLNLDEALAKQSAMLNTPDKNRNFQASALLNRLDIRRSLEKYAAAEAKIKLEIAKQTPDISLTPGFLFEFGDSIWSLGFSALLNLLNKNQTLIAEATQLREVEGTQFEALQARIIGDLGQSLATYEASLEHARGLKAQLEAQEQLTQKLQRQFDAGLIDRLDLTQNQLNTSVLEQQLLEAQFNSLHAALLVEDVMQRPLFDDFSMPTTISADVHHE